MYGKPLHAIAFSYNIRAGVVQGSFEYHRPASLAEACTLLRELGSKAQALAGGTDLLVDVRRGALRPSHLVSLAGVAELRGITLEGDEITIGGGTTPAELETSASVREGRPELLDAVRVFGTPQVRHRATVAGSLCTAASCGDLAPLLMVLDARVQLASAEGHRDLPLTEFFRGHRDTALRPGEVLVRVALRVRRAGEGAAYRAFGQRAANFITVAGVAAFLRLEQGRCAEARVALGAVAPTPVRVPAAEALLAGRPLDRAAVAAAVRAARAHAAPISDLRGSADHRRELVEALCARAIGAAQERAA